VLGDTVVEIVADHLTHAYLPAMQTARAAEKACWDVIDGLTANGDRQTAARVTELLRSAKAKLPVPQAEPAAGQRFLFALLHDPATQLGGP
jgi:hypothetical protein